MKKLIGAAAVCAVAVGLVAVPGAAGKAGTKQVGATMTVSETPNPVVAGATATASGNVFSKITCSKYRTVTLTWVDTSTSAQTPAGTATTGPNGAYSNTVTAPTTPGTYTLDASITGEPRKVGGKHKKNKKGRQFFCLGVTASSSPVTVDPVSS